MSSLIRTDPDWAKVVNYLYENDGYHHLPFGEPIELQQKERLRRSVEQKLNLDSSTDRELRSLFNHLEHVGLVEIIAESEWAEVRLTKSGFEVAHERVLTNRQHWTNKIVAMLTVGLFLAAMIQAVVAYESVPGFSLGLAAFMAVGGVAAIVAILLINFYL